MKKYDFAGWVTKNDTLCQDGLTIKQDAFSANDGGQVPLMWQHNHSDPDNVLGHVKLKNRPEGVYGYGYFNNSPKAQKAKEALRHADINAMSIGAHKLKKRAKDVLHGVIYEVSLVLAGANPGALVEEVLTHGSNTDEHVIIYTDNLLHSIDQTEEGERDMTTEEINALLAELDPETEEAVAAYVQHQIDLAQQDVLEHGILDEDATDDEIIDSLTPQQIELVAELLGADEEDPEEDDEDPEDDTDVTHSTIGGTKMKQNLFSQQQQQAQNDQLIHSINAGIKAGFANESGTFKELVKSTLAPAVGEDELQHGITNIEVLFPDVQALTPTPTIYKDRQTNFEKILNKVTKSPFSRVKAWQADFTEDEARARGYIKGNEKIEQIFDIISRTVDPQTIYKKQGIDRDDVIDIKFDIVPFLNSEMQMMLKEEIARAVLVGDGRPETITEGGKTVKNPDKIYEKHIIPVMQDDTLYTIKQTTASIATMMEDVITILGDYQGSGTPDLYVNPKVAARLRLLKTGTGAYLFGPIPSLSAVAAALGVNEIIPTSFLKETEYAITNLSDYTLGATKGGEITNFQDFDIDFNKYKYLIETRLSGMLTSLKCAIRGTITDPSTPAPIVMKVEQTNVPATGGQ